MSSLRKNARVTGILFIMGTVPMIVAAILWGQQLSAPDYLSSLASSGLQILLFSLTIALMGLSCAGIGVSLYPVLKEHGKGLAISVAGFRVMEGALQVASAAGFIALLALSREFVHAGSPAVSFFPSAGAVLKAVNDWVSNVYVIPWCISAFIYTTVFYRTRLLPRWLSAWAYLGLTMIAACAVSAMLGFLDSSSPIFVLLSLPIMLQEMVLAFWLIFKGYNPKAAVSGMNTP